MFVGGGVTLPTEGDDVVGVDDAAVVWRDDEVCFQRGRPGVEVDATVPTGVTVSLEDSFAEPLPGGDVAGGPVLDVVDGRLDGDVCRGPDDDGTVGLSVDDRERPPAPDHDAERLLWTDHHPKPFALPGRRPQ